MDRIVFHRNHNRGFIMDEKADRFYPRKPDLRAPRTLTESSAVLRALDREIAFYRKRSGQVFFFGLLVEVLIIAGKETIVFVEQIPNLAGPEKIPTLAGRVVYSILFIAVAAVGIALGAEYRRRIRILKDSRAKVLQELGFEFVYPSASDQGLSEIQVLYVVLVLLSSGGIILVWLNPVLNTSKESTSFRLGMLFIVLAIASQLCMAFYVLRRRYRRWHGESGKGKSSPSQTLDPARTGEDVNHGAKD